MKETIEKIIDKGFKSEADVNYFFSSIRILLEDENTEQFRVIKFYSDWILHKKKDNIKEMYNYFEELNRLFNKREVLWDRHVVNKYIEELTSFIHLKDQLKILFKKINIPAVFLYEDELWYLFSNYLRKLIINKPINFDRLKSDFKYRKISKFVVAKIAPFMVGIEDALYWMIFINTSSFPLHGVIPESIGLVD